MVIVSQNAACLIGSGHTTESLSHDGLIKSFVLLFREGGPMPFFICTSFRPAAHKTKKTSVNRCHHFTCTEETNELKCC